MEQEITPPIEGGVRKLNAKESILIIAALMLMLVLGIMLGMLMRY